MKKGQSLGALGLIGVRIRAKKKTREEILLENQRKERDIDPRVDRGINGQIESRSVVRFDRMTFPGLCRFSKTPRSNCS
jgi:hypothetical protein